MAIFTISPSTALPFTPLTLLLSCLSYSPLGTPLYQDNAQTLRHLNPGKSTTNLDRSFCHNFGTPLTLHHLPPAPLPHPTLTLIQYFVLDPLPSEFANPTPFLRPPNTNELLPTPKTWSYRPHVKSSNPKNSSHLFLWSSAFSFPLLDTHHLSHTSRKTFRNLIH